MKVNQQGDEVREYLMLPGDSADARNREELEELIFKILDHLQLQAWWTNATKHGGWEIELRSTGDAK
jgi:hypothetical protein